MQRRNFLKTSAAIGISALTHTSNACSKALHHKKKKMLNAYYFRAHMYTMVPRQVRDDLKWMAEIGTDVVSVAVLEQDLFAAVENIAFISEEAKKMGMLVFAVPSRWGGLFAGAPKVPSLFSVKNPHTWVLEKNGKPKISEVSGVMSSIHYPETYEFICESITKMFSTWDMAGIIWDEPKSYGVDHSPKAIEKLGMNASVRDHIQATVDFHSRLNSFIKSTYPEKTISLFAQAHYSDEIVELAATTQHLDYYGCDGRPWYVNDDGQEESSGKSLLGANGGERFLSASRRNEKNTLWLIENHNLATEDFPLMEQRLPEVINKDVDQLIYYYYPRNVAEPEKAMKIMANHLKKFKAG